MKKKTTLYEYLGNLGLESPVTDYMLDKLRLPHGETSSQQQRRYREHNKVIDEYHKRRNQSIAEYNEKIASGEFAEKTIIEQLIDKASGHPDNDSVQAARRALNKRGVKWNEKQTG
jgi:hypothetical protein